MTKQFCTPDWTSWACQFVFTYPLGGCSLFAGISHASRLPEEDFLATLHAQAREAALHAQGEGKIFDFSEAVTGVALRLMQAVERLLQVHQNKTPICFLSGGWDSRAIVACLAQLLPTRSFQVFTSSYDNGTTREELYATGVAKALNLRHEIIALSPDYYIPHAADAFEQCDYATDMHVWMAEFLVKLRLSPDIVNFDGYAGDLLLRCLLQQTDDSLRSPYDESLYRRLAIIDPALALAPSVARTFKKLAGEALGNELSRYPQEHRMLHFLLDNRGGRGVGHALRLQARSMSVAIPFLDPALFAYILNIDDSVRFRKDFYPNILAAIDPRLKGLPSTNDAPLTPGWKTVPVLKYQPKTLEWFTKNIRLMAKELDVYSGFADWFSLSPLRHKLSEAHTESHRRRRLRALEMLNLFAMWHTRYAPHMHMTPVLGEAYAINRQKFWCFPARPVETEYREITKRYKEKAQNFTDSQLRFHFTMDVEAFPVGDIHSYHTASCQLIDRLIFSEFGSGSDIDALMHQNQLPCTYFLEPYLSLWNNNSRFAEAVNFFLRPWSEIGLHCHTFSLPPSLLDALDLKPGWCSDSTSLTRVLNKGAQRITAVTGEKVAAYRAGRLELYPGFEKAVAAAGFSIDSSFAEGRDTYHFGSPPKNLNNGIQRCNGFIEIPVTAFRTSQQHARLLDFNTASFEEICFIVTKALEIGLPAVTMLMHSWSFSSVHEYPGLGKGFHYASSPLWHEKLLRVLDFLSSLNQVSFATLTETAALGETIFTRSSSNEMIFPPPVLRLHAWRKGRQVMGQSTLLDERQFNHPEYAFYLLVKGKTYAKRWYEKSAEVSFPWPDGVSIHDVALQAFVREANAQKEVSWHVIRQISQNK